MDTLGKILRQKRKEKDLTLEEISQKLKIRPGLLKALEEDHYDQFSAEIYLKGSVKTYADFLEINEKRALALFRREYRRQKENAPIPPQPINKKLLTITPAVIFRTFLALFIILFLAVLYWQYHNYSGKPLLVILNPQTGITLNQNYVQISGKTDTNTNLTINGQETAIEEDGSFEITLSLEEGLNSLIVKATGPSGKITEKILEVQYLPINKKE